MLTCTQGWGYSNEEFEFSMNYKFPRFYLLYLLPFYKNIWSQQQCRLILQKNTYASISLADLIYKQKVYKWNQHYMERKSEVKCPVSASKSNFKIKQIKFIGVFFKVYITERKQNE